MRIVLLMATILLTSCTPKAHFLSPKDLQADMDNIIAVTHWRKAMSGEGNVSVKGHKFNSSVPGALVVQYPDKLRLDMVDPFGSVQGRLIINKGGFWWFDAKRETAWTGPVDHPELKKILPLPIAPTDFIAIMLGRPRFLEGEPTLGLTSPGEKFRSAQNRWESLEWDERWHEPQAWEYEIEDGKLVETIYERYQDVKGRRYPATIRVRVKKDDKIILALVWRWKDVDFKIVQPDKVFQLPPVSSSAKQVRRLY